MQMLVRYFQDTPSTHGSSLNQQLEPTRLVELLEQAAIAGDLQFTVGIRRRRSSLGEPSPSSPYSCLKPISTAFAISKSKLS